MNKRTPTRDQLIWMPSRRYVAGRVALGVLLRMSETKDSRADEFYRELVALEGSAAVRPAVHEAFRQEIPGLTRYETLHEPPRGHVVELLPHEFKDNPPRWSFHDMAEMTITPEMAQSLVGEFFFVDYYINDQKTPSEMSIEVKRVELTKHRTLILVFHYSDEIIDFMKRFAHVTLNRSGWTIVPLMFTHFGIDVTKTVRDPHKLFITTTQVIDAIVSDDRRFYWELKRQRRIFAGLPLNPPAPGPPDQELMARLDMRPVARDALEARYEKVTGKRFDPDD